MSSAYIHIRLLRLECFSVCSHSTHIAAYMYLEIPTLFIFQLPGVSGLELGKVSNIYPYLFDLVLPSTFLYYARCYRELNFILIKLIVSSSNYIQ